MSACICVSMWSVFLHANEKLVVIYLDVHACVFVFVCVRMCAVSVQHPCVAHPGAHVCTHLWHL